MDSHQKFALFMISITTFGLILTGVVLLIIESRAKKDVGNYVPGDNSRILYATVFCVCGGISLVLLVTFLNMAY